MKLRRAILGALLLLLAAPLWAAATGSSIAREALQGISYRPPTAAPSVLFREPGFQPGPATITTLAPFQVVAAPDHTYRDVNEAAATSNLLAPCMLFTRDLASGHQLQALGAPLKPWASDPAAVRLQARFPLVAWAW